MRKFTSLMLMLLCAVTTWGQTFPESSTEDSPKYYTIKSYNRGGYLTNVGLGSSIEHIDWSLNTYKGSMWYFEQANDNGGFYFVNYLKDGENKIYLGNDKKTSTTPAVWYVLSNGINTEGICISSTNPIDTQNNSCIDANNSNSGVGGWHPSTNDWEGTTWVIEERTIQNLTDALLSTTITNARNAYTAAYNNIGTIIGRHIESSVAALNSAIENASTIQAATQSDIETLQAAIDGLKIVLPTAGKYYQFHSAWQSFEQTVALYSNGSNARWQTLDNDDKRYYWLAEETENGGIVMKNANDEKYLLGNTTTSGNWTITDTKTGAEISVKIIDETDSENIEYAIIGAGRHMHAANSTDWWGSVLYEGNIVSWETNAANTCSGWYIKEVELPTFYTITYEFKYDNVTRYTQEMQLKEGATLPAVNVKLPYGVTADAAPEGIVEGNATYEIALNIEKALPFEQGKWYYTQMHMNPNVTSYIQDNNDGIVEWADKDFTADEIDSHLWKFEGDVWSGIKVINKGTGNAITSTSGAATTGNTANATVFFIDNSQAANPACFCLKYPTNDNYLNAQGSAVASWADNDNGSSFLLTEYNEYEATVSSVGYATLFLGYNAFVPEDVEVYAVNSTVSNYATLAEVTGNIPANEGVILKNAGTFIFKTAPTATAIESNMLEGTTTVTDITPAENTAYYVLANGTEGVGLYKDELSGGIFRNNANKAYLPVVIENGNAAPSYSFNFDWAGTTGIEGVAAEGAQDGVIYDITGRRVKAITAPGIYIVNGRKVVK